MGLTSETSKMVPSSYSLVWPPIQHLASKNHEWMQWNTQVEHKHAGDQPLPGRLLQPVLSSQDPPAPQSGTTHPHSQRLTLPVLKRLGARKRSKAADWVHTMQDDGNGEKVLLRSCFCWVMEDGKKKKKNQTEQPSQAIWRGLDPLQKSVCTCVCAHKGLHVWPRRKECSTAGRTQWQYCMTMEDVDNVFWRTSHGCQHNELTTEHFSDLLVGQKNVYACGRMSANHLKWNRASPLKCKELVTRMETMGG